MNKDCSHKFVGPSACAHCGATMEQVKAAGYDEALKLLHEQSAEIARLREELDLSQREHAGDLDALTRHRKHLAMERDLAEANATIDRETNATVHWLRRAKKAEALLADKELVLERYAQLKDDMASARRLLELTADCWAENEEAESILREVEEWLRAHPATATPARSCPRCGGIITQQTHVCPATPAAMGAEPHPLDGLKDEREPEPAPAANDASSASPEDDEQDHELLSAGQRLPFVQVGMVVHHEDSPLSECMIVTEIYDANDGTDGMDATVLSRFGEPGVLTCRDLRQTFRLARDFDPRLTYTGRWGRMPRGAVVPEAEVERDA